MRTWTRLQRATVGLTLAYAFVFVAMLIIRPGTRHFYDAFFNIYQLFPPLFSGIVGLIYFRRGPHTNRVRRAGWLLVSLACLSFTLGQGTWTYLESVRGITVPFPSVADIGYIGIYLLLIPGVFLLFGSVPVVGRFRQLLDSAIAAGSVGALSWTFVIQRVWQDSDIALVGKVISVFYPLADIVALFGAIVLLSSARADQPLRRSLYFLAAGIMGFAFFDTTFTLMSLNNAYSTGSWSDWTISFGWISIGYAFLTKMWWSPERGTEASTPVSIVADGIRSKWSVLLPYVAVGTACLILGVGDYSIRKEIGVTSVVAWLILAGMAIARQVLILEENRLLTRELKTFNEKLEGLVAERTKELEIEHQRVLDAVEERDRFFRHVSHELRTPLTSVVGFAEMLMEDEDDPLTPRQRSQFVRVVEGSHRLLGLVNDLLDISRAEADRMDICYGPVNPRDLLAEVVGSMVPLANERGLELKLVVAEDVPQITTDDRRLAQIVLNLLSNAVKFTPRGRVSVLVSRDRDSVYIAVEDTGIGIPADEIDNIFREFYRVQDGRSNERGTGLGLTIAQKLTNLLGGTLAVVSRIDEGTTFTVTLPTSAKDGQTGALRRESAVKRN